MKPLSSVLLLLTLASSGCLAGVNSSTSDAADAIASTQGSGLPATFAYDAAGAYDFQLQNPIRIGSRTGDPPFVDFTPHANGTQMGAVLEWESVQAPSLRLMRYVGDQKWEVIATAEGPSPLRVEQDELLDNQTYSVEVVLADVNGPLRWSLHVDITSVHEPTVGSA